MKWGASPHPFTAAWLKSYEEIRHQVDPSRLELIDVGCDARKLYFQFSFVEESDEDFKAILNRCPNPDALTQIPLEPDAIAAYLVDNCWEPAAEATLLMYAVNKFGVGPVEYELSKHKLKWNTRVMRDEWECRALRAGDLPDMSVRYPRAQRQELSDQYVHAVVGFMGEESRAKDILEVGPGTGRISEILVDVARELTCLEFCDRIRERHKLRFSKKTKKTINYVAGLAQNYRSKRRHDIAISSLVLIHNVEESLFKGLVSTLCGSANTTFVFEDITTGRVTSPHTKLRSKDVIVQAFCQNGFDLTREALYALHTDTIAFLRFQRSHEADA